MIHETICFFNKFGLNPDGKDKSLPTMYWKQKMQKKLLAHVLLLSQKVKQKTYFKSTF